MKYIEISKLIKHPRNNEFFDDIEGQKWEDFKESIKRNGVVEPIVVTQDNMIVSGHQRVKACEELNLLKIPCRINNYPNYDEKTDRDKESIILEDLISTNIMQRGINNTNPLKFARCLVELEKIKGIQHGGNRYTSKFTQSDLAKELNIGKRQILRYKKLLELIPELQEMVDKGLLKSTIGCDIGNKLSNEEQKELFNKIGEENLKKITIKQIREYIKNKDSHINKKNNLLQKEVKRKPISKSVENHLIARSKGKCEICGYGNLDMISLLEKHHINPISEGGEDNVDNLIMVCPNCHKTIHVLRNEDEEKIRNNILKHLDCKVKEKIELYIK